jgi:hypothetical protein
MGIEDMDLLDRALDAAEDRLESKEEENEIVEADEEVESSEETEEAGEAQESGSEETQEASSDAKKRSTDGRFTSKNKDTDRVSKAANKDLSDQEQEATEEGQEALSTSIEPPQFWSAEDRALFAKVPSNVKQTILKYENQRNAWANKVASESERAKAVQKRLDEAFTPERRLEMQANGIKDPFEAVDSLLAWNEILKKDPWTGIKTLMERNGFTPESFMGGEEQPEYSSDPRVDEALELARAAKAEADEYKSRMEQQETERLAYTINAFKDSKDSRGQTRRGFIEFHAPQIDQAIQGIQAEYPTMAFDEVLHHAYEFVVAKAAGLSYSSSKPASSRVPAQKAKVAAKSVTGAPASGTNAPKPKAKSIDDAIDRAMAQLDYR